MLSGSLFVQALQGLHRSSFLQIPMSSQCEPNWFSTVATSRLAFLPDLQIMLGNLVYLAGVSYARVREAHEVAKSPC